MAQLYIPVIEGEKNKIMKEIESTNVSFIKLNINKLN